MKKYNILFSYIYIITQIHSFKGGIAMYSAIMYLIDGEGTKTLRMIVAAMIIVATIVCFTLPVAVGFGLGAGLVLFVFEAIGSEVLTRVLDKSI